jgi:hypothetical protein
MFRDWWEGLRGIVFKVLDQKLMMYLTSHMEAFLNHGKSLQQENPDEQCSGHLL